MKRWCHWDTEVLVINDYASVHNLPNEKSSADSSFSLGKKGNGSPGPSRDTQDSAEDSVEEITGQPQGAVSNDVVLHN